MPGGTESRRLVGCVPVIPVIGIDYLISRPDTIWPYPQIRLLRVATPFGCLGMAKGGLDGALCLLVTST